MAETNYDGKFDWGREKTGNVKQEMGESAGKGTLMGSTWYATWRDLILDSYWLKIIEGFCVSFLCSGSAMNVAYGPVELKKFLQEAARVSQVCSLFLIFCGVRAGRKSSLPESMVAISSQVGISPDLSFCFEFRTILLWWRNSSRALGKSKWML